MTSGLIEAISKLVPKLRENAKGGLAAVETLCGIFHPDRTRASPEVYNEKDASVEDLSLYV